MKAQIATDNAPQAIGPYSQGMRCGDFYFFSGQIPLDPKTGQMVGETIEAQTTQVLRNIEGLLGSQNLKVSDIVKTNTLNTTRTSALLSVDKRTPFTRCRILRAKCYGL